MDVRTNPFECTMKQGEIRVIHRTLENKYNFFSRPPLCQLVNLVSFIAGCDLIVRILLILSYGLCRYLVIGWSEGIGKSVNGNSLILVIYSIFNQGFESETQTS
jgi:hypothetical protein